MSSVTRRDTHPEGRESSGLAQRGGARAERARSAGDSRAEFLVFQLGTELMGLPLASVQEILKTAPVTMVPRAPRDVIGILSVRGRITTIVDLRLRLGMPRGAVDRHTRILLVDGGEEVIGLVVDAVLHVVRLRDHEIEAAAIVAADLPEHVLGLGRPRRGREGRAGGVQGEASETEVIVLLNPVALLRR